MTDLIHTYFEKLWLTSKEIEIFLSLYKLGTKPASSIAKNTWIERTNVYKTLLKLCEMDLISETTKNGVKHFFVSDESAIKKYVQQKTTEYQALEDQYSLLEAELKKLNTFRFSHIPKITIFDWREWIKNIYNDIIESIDQFWYISIKLFASNTFESQANLSVDFKKYSEQFYNSLKKNRISIDTYLWNWIMIMENISKTIDIDSLKNLPAWNSSINIFVVWKVVYILIFKENPFGIKIDSEDLAYAMHFMFDKLKVE